MKRLAVGVLVFLLIPFCAIAQTERARGIERAQERASEKSVFNRVGDWFATVGRPEEKKEQILQERGQRRIQQQMEREARQVQREAERKTREMKRGAEQKGQEAGERAGQKAGRALEGIPGAGKGR